MNRVNILQEGTNESESDQENFNSWLERTEWTYTMRRHMQVIF